MIWVLAFPFSGESVCVFRHVLRAIARESCVKACSKRLEKEEHRKHILDRRRIVSEGFQAQAEEARQFQSCSVASKVSSQTPISIFSAWFPFFVVTVVSSFRKAIPGDKASLQVFLPPMLLTQTITLPCNASAPPSTKDFKVIRPGSCFPSLYPNGTLHNASSSLRSWTRK